MRKALPAGRRRASGLGHSALTPLKDHSYDAGMESIRGSPQSDDSTAASAILPLRWLTSWVDEETLRACQAPQTTVSVRDGAFIISGSEVIIKRSWFLEPYWRNARATAARGVVDDREQGLIRLRAERRRPDRNHVPILIARLKTPRSRPA